MKSLGIDAGTGSISLAVVEDSQLIYSDYELHKGDVRRTLIRMLHKLQLELDIKNPSEIEYAAVNNAAAFLFTRGNDTKSELAELDTCRDSEENSQSVFSAVSGNVSEAARADRITALLSGQKLLYPEAHSILEMGAQTSAFITGIADGEVMQYAVNGECAAGTGAFFEDQMYRLGLPLEAYSEYTDRAKSVPRLAGRCSVFAKTDLIHRQQEGVPAEDILLGLAFAVIRNFKSTVMRKLPVQKPVLLTGGIVKNRGAVRAVSEILELEPDELICDSELGSVISAAGLAAIALKRGAKLDWSSLLAECDDNGYSHAVMLANANPAAFTDTSQSVMGTADALRSKSKLPVYIYDKQSLHKTRRPHPGESLWLGVDVGSTSTNLVLIGEDDAVLDYCYIRTAGNPGRAVDTGLEQLKPTIDIAGTKPLATAVTGSGRYMIARKLGTDRIIDEITAQAKAAARLYPEVDTVFEIGGQDSKFISIRNAEVVDFEMNKVCAAGTGSFIEEQAGRLDIELEAIGPMALEATAPSELGERCTVLMESKISQELATGTPKADICAGLCRSIVRNYLNRVASNKRIGSCICLQGGIINNEGIVSAFYEQFGNRLRITPYYDVTGALGAALEAKSTGELALGDPEQNKELYHRNREWFYAGYDGKLTPGKETVGIPLSLMMYKFFPMAYKYFTELGYNVLMSGESNEELIRLSQDVTQEETCYPVKLLHGHMEYLARKGVDYMFIPCIRTIRHETSGVEHNYGCVYMQTAPVAVANTLGLSERGIKLLAPVLDMDMGQPQLAMAMIQIGVRLGHTKEQCQAAMKLGAAAMQACDRKSEELGQQIMDNLAPSDKVLVMITRNYGLNDPVLNMGIPGELLKRGCKVLNLSHLHGHSMNLSDEYPNLYWPFSQHILTGAKIIKNHPNLYAVYLTNHGCGPDTMISHLFKEIMGDKPYLSIEVDEHQSAVGVVTRIEAFLNSLKNTENADAAADAGCTHISDVNVSAASNAELNLLPMGIYTRLYAWLLRSKGINVADCEDYTAEDLAAGKQESFSKEYSSFSAAAGRVLSMTEKSSAYVTAQAASLNSRDELAISKAASISGTVSAATFSINKHKCSRHSDCPDSKEPLEAGMNKPCFMLPQTEGAEAEGMYAMVIRALLKEHSADKDSLLLYTPYIEKLLSSDESVELWHIIMLGDALMCMKPDEREEAEAEISFPVSHELWKRLINEWHNNIAACKLFSPAIATCNSAMIGQNSAGADNPASSNCRFSANTESNADVIQSTCTSSHGTNNKRVFLFGSPSILYSDYINRNMFDAVRTHGYMPVPMMLSEYLWYWIRESGKTVPAETEQELNYMRELYSDVWGKKEPLTQAYETFNSKHAPVVGANIRYLCSLIADSIPNAAGSMLLMPTYANAGSVIEMMKPSSPVPFMHFEADGNATPDEIERRDIWLSLLDS